MVLSLVTHKHDARIHLITYLLPLSSVFKFSVHISFLIVNPVCHIFDVVINESLHFIFQGLLLVQKKQWIFVYYICIQ